MAEEEEKKVPRRKKYSMEELYHHDDISYRDMDMTVRIRKPHIPKEEVKGSLSDIFKGCGVTFDKMRKRRRRK
jgi:hypothetical protein